MTEQAASVPEDDLERQIAEEYAKTNESATLETETKEEVIEPQTQEVEAKAEETTDTSSEYVETDNEKIQARINKKHFEMMEARREAESLKAKLEEYEQKQAQAIPKQADGDEPKLSDFSEEQFDYDETARIAAYTSALTDYRINKTLETRESLQAQQQAQYNEQVKQREITDKFLSEAAEYAAKHPSYLEDAATIPQLSQDKLDLLRANGGAKMVHYLGRHPEIASQFANADYGSAAVQLGMLSAQLNTNTKQPEISKAPNPTETIEGVGGAVTKSLDEMSIDEICSMD